MTVIAKVECLQLLDADPARAKSGPDFASPP
jgi:hypothetical protein